MNGTPRLLNWWRFRERSMVLAESLLDSERGRSSREWVERELALCW